MPSELRGATEAREGRYLPPPRTSPPVTYVTQPRYLYTPLQAREGRVLLDAQLRGEDTG